VAVVTGPPEGAEEVRPVHVAEAGQTRDLPAQLCREDAALVESLSVDREVLRLDVQDVRPELPDETRNVDHLEDQVARVEVEPDRAAPAFQDPSPDPGCRREVVPARPLV